MGSLLRRLELAPRRSLRRVLPERVLLLHGGVHLLLPGPLLLLSGPVLLLLLLLLPRVVVVLVVIPVLPGRFRLLRLLLLPAVPVALALALALALAAGLALRRRLQRLALLVGGVRLLPRLLGRLRLETWDVGGRRGGSANEHRAGCRAGGGEWGLGKARWAAWVRGAR